jgi:stage II sporulation protein D
MRRLPTVLIALALAPAAAGAQPHAPRATAPPQLVAATTFLVSGRGWGHGVGMSQYGALGMAREGRGYAEILAHYYPGTTLERTKVASVRVLLVEGAKTLRIAATAPFRVRDALGANEPVPAGEYVLGPNLSSVAAPFPPGLEWPLSLVAGKAPLALQGKRYRGRIDVSVQRARLEAVNVVGLEAYLGGVVPDEMPPSWDAEALKAQAVAARSYALAHPVRGARYDLYADVRSQVYGGVEAEEPSTNAAVKATAREVLLYQGAIADTLFHSTSGGATAAAADVWGKAVPYLVPVDDPGSALSPVHRWGPVAVDAAKARVPLRIRSPILDLRVVPRPDGRARTLVFTTAAGEATADGVAARFALGLRSTWIKVDGVLSLTRPGGPTVFGKAVTVTGRVRGIAAPQLAVRGADGVWTAPAPVAVDANGGFSVKLKARETVTYRLNGGPTGQALLRVPVAPLVRIAREPAALKGTVRPVLPGAPVQLQRQEGAAWVTVAETEVDETGAYRADVELPPGAYRARVAPQQGFAEGLTQALQVAA